MGDTKRGRERSGKNKRQDLIREDLERAVEMVDDEEDEDIFEALDDELEDELEVEIE